MALFLNIFILYIFFYDSLFFTHFIYFFVTFDSKFCLFMPTEPTDEEQYLEIQFNEVLDDNVLIADPKDIYYPFMSDWTMEDYLSFSVSTTLKLLLLIHDKKRIDIKEECGFTSNSSLQRLTNAIGKINSLIRLIHYQNNLSLDSIHLLLPRHITIIVGEHPYIIRYTNNKSLDQSIFQLKHKKYNYFVKLIYTNQTTEYNLFSLKFDEISTDNTYTIFAIIRKTLALTDKTKFKKNTLREVLQYTNYQLLYYFEDKNIGTLSTLLKLADYYYECGIDPLTIYQAYNGSNSLNKLNIYVHDQSLFKKFEKKTIQITHLNKVFNVKIILCPKSLS